jgi:protein-disulfide isomerase
MSQISLPRYWSSGQYRAMVRKMQAMGSGRRILAQLAVAGLIMGALIAFGSPSSSSQPIARQARHRPPPEGRAAREERMQAGVEALFAGIPQHGAVLGDPRAPVTLQFFGDLECPEARQVMLGVMPLLIRKWVRGGELRVVYRARKAETVWPDIYAKQEVAALAAGDQGKAWQYLDAFYRRQGPEYTRYAINHFRQAIAEKVPGLDLAKWRAEQRNPSLAQEVKRDARLASARGIRLTPAFLIGPTGGHAVPLLHFTFTETPAFDEAIKGLLRA